MGFHLACGAIGENPVPPDRAIPRQYDALVIRAESPGTKKFFCKNVFHTKATPLWDGTIFGQVFGRGGMTEISKRKVPPTGGVQRVAQMTFEGTALRARGCSPLLIAPPLADSSLARGPPPGGLTGKLNNLNRGGRACRARAQHKRAHVLHLRRPGGSSPQPELLHWTVTSMVAWAAMPSAGAVD
jgi:hypothetical protein